MTASSFARWSGFAVVVLALVLVPFALFGERLDAWAIAAVEAIGNRPVSAAAVIIGLLAADIVLPVPSSVLSTFGGVFLGFPAGTAVSFVGMSAGCGIGYMTSRIWGRPMANVLLGSGEVARLEALFGRYGNWVLIGARAVPVLAEASVIVAGVGRCPPYRFAALTSLANLGISIVYAFTGAYASDVGSFGLAFVAALAVPLIAMFVFRLAFPDRTTE